MHRRTFRGRSRRPGFTLMELLLVVGILVMLAAFALPSFMGTQLQAQKDAASAQISTYESTLRLYRSQTNNYPSTDQGLLALLEKPEEDPIPKRWAGPYMEELADDPWGGQYQYAYPGEFNEERNKPDIWSFGPDGEDGTEDDIGNWKPEEGDDEFDDSSGDSDPAPAPARATSRDG